jgi:hypothetical protein
MVVDECEGSMPLQITMLWTGLRQMKACQRGFWINKYLWIIEWCWHQTITTAAYTHAENRLLIIERKATPNISVGRILERRQYLECGKGVLQSCQIQCWEDKLIQIWMWIHPNAHIVVRRESWDGIPSQDNSTAEDHRTHFQKESIVNTYDFKTNLSALWTYSQSPVLKGDHTYSVEKKASQMLKTNRTTRR